MKKGKLFLGMYAAAGATGAYGGEGATGTLGAAGAMGAYDEAGLKKGKLFFVHTILLYCSVSESLTTTAHKKVCIIASCLLFYSTAIGTDSCTCPLIGIC